MAKTAVSKFLRGIKEESAEKSVVPTEKVEQSISRDNDEYVALRAQIADLEARANVLESGIVIVSGRIYSERALSGNFAKSMNLDGETTPGVQVTYSDKFSTIEADSEAESELRKAVGKRFDELFEEKREISLEKSDDATIQLLLEKLGEEAFAEIFKVKVRIAAKKGFDKIQFELPPQVREIVKQASPSVKVRKG